MAIAATVAGTALLVGLKVPFGSAGAVTNTGAVATVPHTPGATGPGASGPGAGGPGTSATAKPTRTPTSGPGRTNSKPPPTAAPPPATRTIDGSREPASDFGYVQVRITVSGGRLTAITMLEVTSRPNSAARGAPGTLIQEALDAQSANIANVSRATFTSNAFKASLQSALSRA